jgi:hypothetical protein
MNEHGFRGAGIGARAPGPWRDQPVHRLLPAWPADLPPPRRIIGQRDAA